MKTMSFEPRKIAIAVAASLLGPVAFASQINYAVDRANLRVTDDASYVHSTTIDGDKTPGSEAGYVLIDHEEGVQEPGIGAYTVPFQSDQKTPFDGCIMSSKGAPDASWEAGDSCKLPPDSGKRFKLRATKLNQPMDIVFNLTSTDDFKRYNVYGKFSNHTGHPATGYTVQVGTGIGDDFKVLPGVELMGGEEELGKFPGGLFGGSAVEGLPFFSPRPELFEATADTKSSLHTRTTDGLPKTQNGHPGVYETLFQDWLPVQNVPVAWTYDDDGKPWTDNKIVAYMPSGGATWTTYKKSWSGSQITLMKSGKPQVVTLSAYGSLDPTRPEYNDPSNRLSSQAP